MEMSDVGDDSCGTKVKPTEQVTDFCMEDHMVSVKNHKKMILWL